MQNEWIGRFAGLLGAIALGALSTNSEWVHAAERAGDEDAPFVQLAPQDQVVEFRQVRWELRRVSLQKSDWGQVAIDPAALRRKMQKTKQSLRYVNVFLYAPGVNEPFWVVENLYMPPSPCPAPGGFIPEGPTIPGGPTGPAQPRGNVDREPPLCRYLDLRPHVDNGRGKIPWVEATVLLSTQPAPIAHATMRAVEGFASLRFKVSDVTVNAEGAEPDPLLDTLEPRRIDPALPLGGPPPPVTPRPGPVADLLAPICVFQNPAPNFECASYQCGPMGVANTIQWLEDTYDGNVHAWRLPELPSRGIGRHTPGDISIWEPVPHNSVVANVDFFTRRIGVSDANSGGGCDLCMQYRGLFGYLTFARPYTGAEFRHQGTTAQTIGEGTTCDDIPSIDLGGNVSHQEGAAPTWQWIFDQLVLGRGVFIWFAFYDVDGNWTGGHCVRVWGACRFGPITYLHTLDDGQQGANSVGTRTQSWRVEDTGSPGMPGVPNGVLNMNGKTWEIEFAASIQAKPTALLR